MSENAPNKNIGPHIKIRDMRGNNNGFSTLAGSTSTTDLIFPAYVTSFSDEFTSNYESTNVYGRMDPIYAYQNTQRVINLAFTCPSRDEKEASYYLRAISALARSMYPNYSKSASKVPAAATISSPPMFGIQFGNLISDSKRGYLMGVIPSFSFTPVFDEGMFVLRAENGAVKDIFLPKSIEVSLTFNPLHDFEMGFGDAKSANSEQFGEFPYDSWKASLVSKNATPSDDALDAIWETSEHKAPIAFRKSKLKKILKK